MKRAKAIVLTLNSGVRKLWRWFGDRLKDLFYATGNQHLELARTVTGILTSLIVFAVLWNSVKLGQPIQLGELLTGLAAFVTASGLGILAKDWVRTKIQGKINDLTNDP